MRARDENKKEISFIGMLMRLYPMIFKGAPILFISCNIVGIIHGMSFGFNTFASQRFFDSVAGAVASGAGAGAVIGSAAVLGVVVIGSQILNGIHNFMGNTFFKKMEGVMGMEVNKKAARIDPISYESPALLDDINKASAGASNSIGIVFITTNIFTFYLPYFIFMGVYLFKLKPTLALSLLLVFIPVIVTQFIRSAVYANLEDEVAPVRREYEYYERCICDREYFKETRILGAFTFFKDLYRHSLDILGKKEWDAQKKTDLLELGMRLITLSGYFGVLYLLFMALIDGDISVGAFAAVFASIDMLFGIMEEIVCRHIGGLARNFGMVRNFINFLDLPERKGQDLSIDAGEGIVIENVSFRYPRTDENSISNVSLKIEGGETIAIVGENGAGKTTLVKLMIGLYHPSEGSVKIGGVDTKKASSESIYRGISAVFQKYQRYKMTLDENVHISNIERRKAIGEVADSRLANSIHKADLDIKSGSFPEGYHTMLAREFGGVDLSGGQWQRVAIARGFYRVHDMIVLDEPTAAIDPLEETQIYKKFAEISRGKTSVIVTHRLGSAKIADRIVVMDGGKIVEVGTHDQLISVGGKYAQMFNAQAGWYVS